MKLRNRCAALQNHQIPDITHSSPKKLHAKPLSSELSAHQSKAAHQTPKYSQLPKKARPPERGPSAFDSYDSKLSTIAEKKRKKFFCQIFFWELSERGPSAPPREGLRPLRFPLSTIAEKKKKKQFFKIFSGRGGPSAPQKGGLRPRPGRAFVPFDSQLPTIAEKKKKLKKFLAEGGLRGLRPPGEGPSAPAREGLRPCDSKLSTIAEKN